MEVETKMKTHRVITGVMAIFLMSLFGVGQVGIVEAQNTGIPRVIGAGGAISITLCIMVVGIIMPFFEEYLITLFSFTGVGTSISDMFINIFSNLFILIYVITDSIFSMVGFSSLFGSLLEGSHSSIVWFFAKWNYITRMFFLTSEQAMQEVF